MSKKFQPLDYSRGWDDYWRDHPQGYSPQEQMVNWSGQLNAMIDFFNQYFDVELTEYATDVMEGWYFDGRLDEIINETLFDSKADKTTVNSLIDTVEDMDSKINDITISVKDFGAKGDGVTDDTLAIRNAINSTHGIVFIPNGRYLITEQIIIPHDITIIGVAANTNGRTTLKFMLPDETPASTPVIKLADGVRAVRLSNLYIRDYSANTQKYDGISTVGNNDYCVNLVFSNVWVVNFKKGFNMPKIYLTTFTKCHAVDNYDGFYFPGFSTSLLFNQCYSASNKNHGFYLDNVVYSSFLNTVVESTGGVGFKLNNCKALSFQGCATENVAVTAFTIDYSQGVTIDTFFSTENGEVETGMGTIMRVQYGSMISVNNLIEHSIFSGSTRANSIVCSADCEGTIDNVKTILPNMFGSSMRVDGQYSALSPPAAGVHYKGKIVINRGVAVGQPLGWVCLNSGSPYTWAALQTVE